MNDFVWLLYWKCRESELNPELPVKIKLSTTIEQEWSLEIELKGTAIENSFRFDASFFDEWGVFMHCQTLNGTFKGVCRRSKVIELIRLFRESVQHCFDINPVVNLFDMSDCSFVYLLDWYIKECDKKYQGEIWLQTLSETSWGLSIDLRNSLIEGKNFSRVENRKDDYDWYVCELQAGKFVAETGLLNLPDALEAFRSFTGESVENSDK